MNRPVIALALVCSVVLAACSTVNKTPPPEVPLEEFVQAQAAPEPIKPMTVVPVPEPLPLPAQLKPLTVDAAASPPEKPDPRERVAKANDEARVTPTREGYLNAIQVWPYAAGALYQIYAPRPRNGHHAAGGRGARKRIRGRYRPMDRGRHDERERFQPTCSRFGQARANRTQDEPGHHH